MKTILVGYDESEAAERALARAAELAVAFDAKVIVTSVAQLLVGAAARGIGPIDPVDTPAMHREELRHAAAFLDQEASPPSTSCPSATPPTRSSSSQRAETRI
jgi:nucleotide-binding universal stress UspA family protein